ncbi:hypothetical protein [Streptomyces sp. A5-4]|uniref:hypothetical protein n=1 Tax=Streptomyces sp. A5-4 TaxID=3384771 RepID=UPI003DA875AF
MEPREFWDRNTVLAEAFCTSDERLHQAQSVLDEAQAERSRTLAAFAITVGNDGTVADLMGLNEREVRLARRTVGRGDARTVAEELLERHTQMHTQPVPQAAAQSAPPPPPAAVSHQQGAPSYSAAPPGTRQQMDEPAAGHTPPMEIRLPHPREETVPHLPHRPLDPAPSMLQPPEADNNTVLWSPSMDSVLLWSWQSGLDLQTVAAELGLDTRTLLLRVQALADNNMLTPSNPNSETNQEGRHRRHRRHHEETYTPHLSPTTTTFPTHVH